MKRDAFKPEHQRLRNTIANHLRRSRRLRHVEPELAREHRTLADLYKRHIEMELEFGREKSWELFRAVGSTLYHNR